MPKGSKNLAIGAIAVALLLVIVPLLLNHYLRGTP